MFGLVCHSDDIWLDEADEQWGLQKRRGRFMPLLGLLGTSTTKLAYSY